jgi:hypothetical protein
VVDAGAAGKPNAGTPAALGEVPAKPKVNAACVELDELLEPAAVLPALPVLLLEPALPALLALLALPLILFSATFWVARAPAGAPS